MASFTVTSSSSSMAALSLLLGLMLTRLSFTDAKIGVCNGMLGNNLPPASQVIALYKANNIRRMRLYDPNRPALQALRGSNIEIMLGVPNSDLQSLAASRDNARAWVQRNVMSFWPSVKFKYIAVGNEVSPVGGYSWLARYVLPAIQNVYQAIRAQNLHNQIKVSTAIDMTLIGNSYPPSKGSFRNDVRAYLDPIIGYLVYANAPLFTNVYPYFSHSGNPGQVSLPYALFTSPSVVVRDGMYSYQNLFDAMLDSVHAAIDATRIGYVEVVVSESGWPSAGGFAATFENARTYYTNLVRHVQKGTPRRPNKPTETYLFAMFDENNKSPEIEKHFGVFYPNKQKKYNLNFGGERQWEVSDEYNVTVPLKSDM